MSRPAYATVRAAQQGVARALAFDNHTRPPPARDGHTAASGEYREAPRKNWTMLSKQARPPHVEVGVLAVEFVEKDHQVLKATANATY